MPGAAAGDDGDLRLMTSRRPARVNGVWTSVKNLVDVVERRVRVGQGDAFERTGNEVGWVVDEVICYARCLRNSLYAMVFRSVHSASAID
jgi:hypothetical protein